MKGLDGFLQCHCTMMDAEASVRLPKLYQADCCADCCSEANVQGTFWQAINNVQSMF